MIYMKRLSFMVSVLRLCSTSNDRVLTARSLHTYTLNPKLGPEQWLMAQTSSQKKAEFLWFQVRKD